MEEPDIKSGWSTHHELRFIEALGSYAVTGFTPVELLRGYRMALINRKRMAGMDRDKLLAKVHARMDALGA
jgi:hypothetical protein